MQSSKYPSIGTIFPHVRGDHISNMSFNNFLFLIHHVILLFTSLSKLDIQTKDNTIWGVQIRTQHQILELQKKKTNWNLSRTKDTFYIEDIITWMNHRCWNTSHRSTILKQQSYHEYKKNHNMKQKAFMFKKQAIVSETVAAFFQTYQEWIISIVQHIIIRIHYISHYVISQNLKS